MNQITKPSIFVVSSGRTGTRFFSRMFDRLLPDCDSFHEPEVVSRPYTDSLRIIWKHFGLAKCFCRKFTLGGSLRKLSIARRGGAVSDEFACEALYRLRQRFVASLKGASYAECNLQLWGMIDLVPKVFSNSRIVYLVRDGRDWITSLINFSGGFFGPRDIVQKLGMGRLTPATIPGDEWADAWASFSQFQKHCWTWERMNRFSVEGVKKCPNARLWRFEDVFASENRYEHLADLVEFATAMPDGTRLDHGGIDGLLEKRIHASQPNKLQGWRDWTPEMCRQFHEIGSGLMGELGYGQEPEWCEKLAAAGVSVEGGGEAVAH